MFYLEEAEARRSRMRVEIAELAIAFSPRSAESGRLVHHPAEAGAAEAWRASEVVEPGAQLLFRGAGRLARASNVLSITSAAYSA